MGEDGVLAKCKYFTAEKLDLSGKAEVKIDEYSFRSIIVANGACKMRYQGEEFDLIKGDSVFIPAQDASVYFEGNAEIIISRV